MFLKGDEAKLVPLSQLRRSPAHQLVHQPILQYFDAVSAPFVFADADIKQTSVSSATISGYLLDCVTTSYAAIAP